MLRKFLEGLVFGSGFALSFIVLLSLTGYLLAPMLAGSPLEHPATKYSPAVESELPSSGTQHFEAPTERDVLFSELPLEEEIQRSSAIALAKYERAPDGRLKAIIKEFLKKDPHVTIYYNIGDEHTPSSQYPKDHTTYGDGVVIFFTGNPASMRMSVSYSGDRIRSLGDLPIELLRKKCKDPIKS